jgi:hypothetical protein
MPYPVPPFEPPAIVEYQMPESHDESITAENFSIAPQPQRLFNVMPFAGGGAERSRLTVLPVAPDAHGAIPPQAFLLGGPLEVSWPLSTKERSPSELTPKLSEINISDINFPEINFSENNFSEINISQVPPAPAPPPGEAVTPNPPPTEGTPLPLSAEDVVKINSDRQEYNEQRQVVTGEGNVFMRLGNTVLNSQWLQVNLLSRFAVAQGQVLLTNGTQVIEGDRLEYDIVRNQGGMQQAKGQIVLNEATSTVATTLPTDVTAGAGYERALTERLRAGEPPRRVTNTGGLVIGVGAGLNQGVGLPTTGGTINRLRFESDDLTFTGEDWQGTNVRITNDPYSPPELELRSRHVTVRRLSPEQDEVIARRPRLVFENKVSIPLLRERVIIDRRERDPSLIRFGYDGGDRGGFYAETPLEPIVNDRFQFSISPQFYIQKAISGPDSISDLFGFKTRVNGKLSPTTNLEGRATFTTLNPDTIDDKTRANLLLRQQIGTHSLTGEYAYRDRIFNGSLGFRTVQQSLGVLLNSPIIPLGKTGINLSYEGSIQSINADTDQIDLLEPIRETNRTSLTRFQGGAALSRGFLLWQGTPLPATPEAGIKYTPSPVIPYIRLFTGLNGTLTGYSNGDTQNFVSGSIGIQGQFGHFSRRWLDYTGWSVSLSRIWKDGASPFLFDRIADSKVLALGLTQQIYGPIRFGVQTLINLDTKEAINTDLILEYSRRSYGLAIRYNPEQQLGSLSLRISDFNWRGGGEPFSRSEVRSVDGGVRRVNQEIQ